MPDAPAQPQPTGNGYIDATGRVIGRVATLSPQAMQNLIIVVLVLGLGAFIYVDKQDRYERDALMMRHYEGQHESMRQVVTGNTVAVQALALQVGKLEQSVETFRRAIQGKIEELGLADDGRALVNSEVEVDLAAPVDAVANHPLARADQLHVAAVVTRWRGHGEDDRRRGSVRDLPVNRPAVDRVVTGVE